MFGWAKRVFGRTRPSVTQLKGQDWTFRNIQAASDLKAFAAAQPDTDIAVAALAIAQALVDRKPDAAFGELWAKYRDEYIAMERVSRAAFMNGFRQLAAFELANIAPPVDPAHCISQDREVVCAPLRKIAEAATEEQRHDIATSDYGNAEKYRQALDTVIDEKNCVISGAKSWFPREVVELTSHVPDKQGYLPATAILLVTSIHNGDEQGSVEFRWEDQGVNYIAMPEPTRITILQAIRHCYEADKYWMEVCGADDIEATLATPIPAPIYGAHHG